MIKSSSPIKVESAVKVLTYLIVVIGASSVVRYIGLFYPLAFLCLFLLSLYLDYRRRFFVPRWLLTGAALSVIVITLFRVHTDDLVEVSLGALLILLAIKLLTDKRFRDYMQIYLIVLFLLTGSALLSLDIEFLFYLIALTFLVSVAMVLLTYCSQDSTLEMPAPSVRTIVLKSSLIPLLAIPMTLFMFIILPRTSYPLFYSLQRGSGAHTGFSDTVSLGNVSDIQEDPAVVLRAHMERVDENSLYWRGIVLDTFDGISWQSMHKELPDNHSPLLLSGKRIPQTIYLEPYGNKYLFALDKPSSISLRYVSRYRDLTHSFPFILSKRIRYETLSALSDVFGEREIDRSVYLQLPEGRLARTKELARSLSRTTQEDTIQEMLNFLRNGAYRYSLQNLPLSNNPLEDFLFNHKYGNCEYFASAMAVMLRMAGIPSRVVGGYRGGYYNDAGEYYLVPQKNAHVWVEAYLESGKWKRFDPTPAGIEHFVSFTRRDIFFKVRFFLDTINYYWNALVINYDFAKQMTLLQKLRSFKRPKFHFSLSKEQMVRYSAGLLVFVFSALMIYLVTSKRRAPEEKLLEAFTRKMGKYGYRKALSEGLEEFVSRIEEAPLQERAHRFVREFERFYYKDIPLTRQEMKRLKCML
jgi:transglutaminase-like putative cysteine protease